MKNNKNYYAVILAGGVGSRFWPVSKSSYPKQFHDMMGRGETLLQSTFHRLTKVIPSGNILILTNKNYFNLVQEQLPEISGTQIIKEPAMRNTAPCILMAALKIQKSNPEALMLVAPSDHFIEDEASFALDVEKAFKAADENKILITLGIKPTFPNTGYGYIKYQEQDRQNGLIQKVLKFVEKPNLTLARQYLEEGNYLWNAGIFVWSSSFILDSFAVHSGDMYGLFAAGKDKYNTTEEENFVEDVFPKAENISIDYAILEKSEEVFVIPASFDWDDLGTWGALYNKLEKDRDNNAIVNAQMIVSGASKNIVHTDGYKVVVLDGLENYIIVDDKDVLMIVPKEKEQEIKKIREEVIRKYGENLG